MKKKCVTPFLWYGKAKKMILIMKLTVFILFLSLMQVSASVYSQSTRFSFKAENKQVVDVLRQIEENSNFRFIFLREQVDVERKVSVTAREASVEQILEELFKDELVSYEFANEALIILTRDNNPLGSINNYTQQNTLTGKVTDKEGQPLPGVTILVKGTTLGTVTNADGNYSLANIPEDATLVFSFVGMRTQEIVVGNQTSVNVTMEFDAIGIEEVVAIGYGSMKKSDLTGSVSSVKSETLENLPAKSLSEALQGKVAGVYVTKGSGAPGSGTDIMIRGAASINGLSPLFIVDGVRMGTGNNFNMSDVESVEILKDASSAAIYGVEAAGGVILVTTKKGSSQEKMHIDFNAYYGTRSAVDLPELLNSDDYIRARKIMGVEYDSWNNSTEDTDWVDELYNPAIEQKYDLALSGGNERSTYYISAGYLKEEGIRIHNWFERYSTRINSDHKLSDNFTVGQFLYISKTKNRPPGDGQSLPYRSIPMMAVYDDSRVGGWAAVPDGYQGNNWVGSAEALVYNNNQWGMEGNFFADWKIFESLNLRTTVGGYMGGIDNSQFNLLYDFGILKNGIRKLSKELSRNETINGNAVLTYNKTFGKHEVKAMAGWEVLKSNGTNIWASTEGFPVSYMPSFDTSTQSTNSRSAGAGYGISSQVAQFGRLNYNYAGKYILQGTVRRDGTNKFIGENRYGVFPSLSGAWRISEEAFLKEQVSWLSNFKLRAGWGVLGSIGTVGDFIYQSSYKTINKHSFDGATAVTGWGNAKFANSDIRWEKVTTKNLGLDLGLFSNKLFLTAEVYDKQTTDMIYTVALPPSSGMGGHNGEYTATVNIGEISNKGLELELSWNDKIGQLSYSIGANASFNKNKVIQIGEEGSIIYGFNPAYMSSSISRTEDGYPMGQFYGYIADGIFQTDAEAAASAQPNAMAGDLVYRDINGKDASGELTGIPDGKIDDADKTYIGNPWPKSFYGFSLNLEYKGFDLKAYFQGQAGIDIFNTTKSIKQSFYADYNTTAEIFNTSKFGNNTITSLPSVYQKNEAGEILRDPNGNYKNISSYFVEDGSYLKLKDLQIGYTLPETASGRIGISQVRFFVAGSNLLTFTKYTGLDPEIGGDVNTRGIETNNLYPQTRFVSLGVNLSF